MRRAEAIGQHAKQQRTNRPKRQRGRGGKDDGFFGDAEFPRQRVVQENNHEEVERVQRPTKESRENGVVRSRFSHWKPSFG